MSQHVIHLDSDMVERLEWRNSYFKKQYFYIHHLLPVGYQYDEVLKLS